MLNVLPAIKLKEMKMKVSSQGNHSEVCKLLPPENGTGDRGWLEDGDLVFVWWTFQHYDFLKNCVRVFFYKDKKATC